MPQAYRVEKWAGELPLSMLELKRTMEDEGYCVYQWSDPPGATYSTHTHGTDQSHWIVSGSLELEVSGYGKVRLSPGDRDFMPANTEHAATVIGDESVIYLIGAR